MNAIQIQRFGGPEVLELVDIPVPEPGPGEVLVEITYAGVNFTDIYRRSGVYANSPTYRTPLPYGLGIEGSGTVKKLGTGVDEYSIGERVVFTRSQATYAEYAVTPAHRLVRVPDLLGLDVAAAVISQGMAAHYLTHEYGLKAGDVCLVHAGAGGVGQLLIQLAKMRGARVIATVGTKDKERIARACGADEVILYREVNFREATRALTHDRGVDIVFDSVGKDTLHDSLYSLRRHGLCVLFGQSSGEVAGFNTLDLAEAGSVFLTRPHAQHYVATPEVYARRANDILRWIGEGRLKVAIHHVYPLAEAAAAHRALAGRSTHGKLLIGLQPETHASLRSGN